MNRCEYMWIANSPINPSTFLWKIRYSQSDDVCILAHGAWTENSEIAATWKGPVLPSPSRLHLHFRGTRRSMMCKDVKISGLKVAVGYWVKTWKTTNFEEWDSTKKHKFMQLTFREFCEVAEGEAQKLLYCTTFPPPQPLAHACRLTMRKYLCQTQVVCLPEVWSLFLFSPTAFAMLASASDVAILHPWTFHPGS